MKASSTHSRPLTRSLKASAKGLAIAEFTVVLEGAAWAGFYPDHMKRVFDASPWNSFVLFVMTFGFLVLLVALALFCGAWFVLARRGIKS